MTEPHDDPQQAYALQVEAANRDWYATATALEEDYRQALIRPGQDQSPAALHSQYLRRRTTEQTAWRARTADAAATYRERTGQRSLPPVGWTPAAPEAIPASGTQPARARKPFDRSRWLPLIAVVGGLVVLAIIGTAISDANKTKSTTSGSGGTGTAAYSSTVEVLYEVEGTATGTNITIEAPTGTVQGNNKAVPLGNPTTGKKGISYTMPRGHFVYLSAQNTGAKGTITCRITVDGKVVASNTSSGGYAIAGCSGTAY